MLRQLNWVITSDNGRQSLPSLVTFTAQANPRIKTNCGIYAVRRLRCTEVALIGVLDSADLKIHYRLQVKNYPGFLE